MKTGEIIVVSFISICVLLYAGHWLRLHVRMLRKLFLPACVIGGLLGLVIKELARSWGVTIPAELYAGWGKLPGFLINIVFACLFLGHVVPKVRTLWRRAGAQLAYGQIVAWGQYVVGVGLVMLLLRHVFSGVEPIFGGLIPVGFEGGHGTASGLKSAFVALGFPEGVDLAVASATVGIVGALAVGIVLVNWAARRGHLMQDLLGGRLDFADKTGVIDPAQRVASGKVTISPDAIGTLSLHVCLVALAILIGYAIQQMCLVIPLEAWIASLGGLPAAASQPASAAAGGAASQPALPTLAEHLNTFKESFPLFPLCMIGGLIVQKLADRFDRNALVDGRTMRSIQNMSLDFLVIAAIVMIRTDAVIDMFWPFAIIVAAGIAWNVFCVLVLARRLLPDAWFERSIAEMGQSMGVTATGLLLLRLVDPDYQTPAADAFACKQVMHEPFMGGGLWTSTAIPLLVILGGWPVLGIACAGVVVWSIVGSVMAARRRAGAAGGR